MRLFQLFFPIIFLFALALVALWLAPRRGRKHDADDIDAVLDHQRQVLQEAMAAAMNAIEVAREANRELRTARRELEHLADLREHPKTS